MIPACLSWFSRFSIRVRSRFEHVFLTDEYSACPEGSLDKNVKNKHKTGMTKSIPASQVFEDETFPLAFRRVDNHQDTNVHRHEFYELVIILTGRGRHITDREEYAIEAGDVFLLRGAMAHGYAGMARMTLVNILFDPARLGLPMGYLEDVPGYHALFHVEPQLRAQERFRSRLRLAEAELTQAAGMIVSLQQELERKRPGYRFQACAILMELIDFLSRCYSHVKRHEERASLRVGEVLSYIEQHYREPLTIRQLTRIAHMSESTLLRTFRRVLGRTPMVHVIRLRIMRAAEILQGDARITETAFECGFSDSNYFSRQFRQIMGVSPRQFRDGRRAAVRRSQSVPLSRV